MDYLPLFHKLQGALVLVVGGGEIALRKARLLADAGAALRVVVNCAGRTRSIIGCQCTVSPVSAELFSLV